MDRHFGPHGGFGFGHPHFFNPFFFPQRRFVPFFFFSPFFFPFFREGDDRHGSMVMQHTCGEGDTMEKVAQTYNVPVPILEAMNPHMQSPYSMTPGTVMQIPRMDKMYCQKMYVEQDATTSQPTHMQSPQYASYAHPAQQQSYPGYTVSGQ
ncbi:MAG: LysM protein [Paenibacillus sp.]|nr:LysM protein [Paenibacillus sp.]